MKKNAIKRMFAAAKKATVLELFIYGEIGEDWFGGGITPQSITDAIKQAKTDGGFDSITVHLNSPGGSAFDGVAVFNVLRQQNCPINVIVEGLAASAAFTIAMSGNTIQVCDGAMMMLHNAWSFAIGDATEMRAQADILDKVSATMSDVYAKRSGLSLADVQTLMNAETWLTPQEAVDKGFADAVLSTTPEKSKEAAALVSQFNLKKMFKQVPDALKADAADGDMECECWCPQCEAGDCKNCSHGDCDCEGCTCDSPYSKMSTEQTPEAKAAAAEKAAAEEAENLAKVATASANADRLAKREREQKLKAKEATA